MLIITSLVESIGKSATRVPPPFWLFTCTYVCVDSWKWSHPKLTLRTAFFLDIFTFEGAFFLSLPPWLNTSSRRRLFSSFPETIVTGLIDQIKPVIQTTRRRRATCIPFIRHMSTTLIITIIYYNFHKCDWFINCCQYFALVNLQSCDRTV